MRILLVADRSAGHIYPAWILAKAFKENNKVYIFLTSNYFKDWLRKKGFLVLGRELPFRNVVLEMAYRIIEGLVVFLKTRPQRVIGFGGKATIFLILLSSFFSYTAIYEPNSTIGKTNSILGFFVKKIYWGFNPWKISKMIERKTIKVGIPIRSCCKKWSKEEARKILGFHPWKPVVFCFGGSQGSRFINNVFKRLLEESKIDFQVIHLTGQRDYSYFKNFYGKIFKKNYLVKDFSWEVGLFYSASDILISRAGALTCAEVSYYKVLPLFIPHPQASQHQEKNALYFVQHRAGYSFSQRNFSFQNFKVTFEKILTDSLLQKRVKERLGSLNLWVEESEFCNKFLPFVANIPELCSNS